MALVTALFAGAVLPLSPAHAIEIQKIAGHTIEIREHDFEKVLAVDGRELHANQFILLDDIHTVGGTIAVIGSSSAGGNACDGTPFVLSFPAGGEARLDGPIDVCASVGHAVEGEAIVFSTGKVPGRDIERWRWTAEGGLVLLAPIAFAPEAGSGWDDLRERAMSHPADAFGNAEIAEALRTLLGADFDHFQTLMTGVGGGTFKGEDFAGTACRPHACLDEAGLVYLSAPDRRAYVAWKPEGGKIVVYPAPVKAWPEKAKAELREWAKQWP